MFWRGKFRVKSGKNDVVGRRLARLERKDRENDRRWENNQRMLYRMLAEIRKQGVRLDRIQRRAYRQMEGS